MKKGKYGKIDRKFKKQWIAALESGNFDQGTECLKTEDGEYCCLGVACEISGKGTFTDYQKFVLNGHEQYFDEPELDLNNRFTEIVTSKDIMPKNLRREIGLTNRAQTRLYKMNDSGMSFKEIAAWIRKYL